MTAPLPLSQVRDGMRVAVSPDAAERAAVAERLGLVSLDRFEATLTLSRDGERIEASGRLRAAVVQACVASGAPVPATVDQDVALIFLPEPPSSGDSEVELGEGDLDVVFHDGRALDLLAAMADDLSLALDPYPRSPEADSVLRGAGVLTEEEAGPFAALAALRGKPE